MTTLNIHAQESKSRFSCLSAADPENIPDVRKKYEIKAQNTTENTEIKQTAAARPKGGAENFEVGGAKFGIFALTYNVQFWSYEHVVNMFLVSFDLKKHLGTLSERSEHQK